MPGRSCASFFFEILHYIYLEHLLGSVWFAMGLYCKVLGLITRHELIVGEILGKEIAPFFTPLIGVGEVLLGLWIVTGYQRKLTSVTTLKSPSDFERLWLSLSNWPEFTFDRQGKI